MSPHIRTVVVCARSNKVPVVGTPTSEGNGSERKSLRDSKGRRVREEDRKRSNLRKEERASGEGREERGEQRRKIRHLPVMI